MRYLDRTVYTSVAWINDYLDRPADPAEQGELLTRAGFPLEGEEAISGADVRQDYEMTSNRGDCVCHVGLAREIAAISDRRLKAPAPDPKAAGPAASGEVSVTNRRPDLCPLYTARLIRGVRVGPSPGWIADRLRAINQIPRNNIVDASNFVLFELGQPTHVFDLAKLAGPEIIIRMADPGEQFIPIGEGAEAVKLTGQDLVIADAVRAVALAGVKGGGPTAVTDGTTDVLIEAATFDPVAVRNAGRRHGIESDSGYRFERGVPAGQVDAAARRLAELILQTAGGRLLEGVVSGGAPIPPPAQVLMDPDRCRALLGVAIETERMVAWLGGLEFQPRLGNGVIHCTVPVHRLDIHREIDLIEEVGRMMGHDTIPVTETIKVRVTPLQPEVMARRAANGALVGMGFVETVTHGLIAAEDGAPFLPAGVEALGVADLLGGRGEQAGSVLRPSLLPSLLRVLEHNHNMGTRRLKLFESGSTFQRTAASHTERRQLGLVMDLQDPSEGLRPLRGVLDRLVEMLRGHEARLHVTAGTDAGWYAPGATVSLDGKAVGRLGLIGPNVADRFGLDDPVAAAEIDLQPLVQAYPPDTEAGALPIHPPVERDVSAIVAEDVPWSRVRQAVDALDLDYLEAVEFVSAFRGRQIGNGRKSVTLRVRFRAADHTLKHDSVDQQLDLLMKTLTARVGAEIRR